MRDPKCTAMSHEFEKFLCPNIRYLLPTFSTNLLDSDLFLTLNVKGVDPASVVVLSHDTKGDQGGSWIYVKFCSTSPGTASNHFAFRLRFPGDSILEHSVEVWDNNVVLQLSMKDMPVAFEFGLNTALTTVLTKPNTLKDCPSSTPAVTTAAADWDTRNENSKSFTVQVHGGTDQAVRIELTKGGGETHENRENQPPAPVNSAQNQQKQNNKKERKKSKERSFSESHCDTLKGKTEPGRVKGEESRTELGHLPTTNVASRRKERSVSESSGGGEAFHFKSILKTRRLNRSTSESYSSMDEQSLTSLDMVVGSFGDIPEEEDGDIAATGKKSVTFNDVIKKQLFRSDSSIVGRRLKNLKKQAKKRADRLRLSESENSEPEVDKRNPDEDESDRRDSGVDCSMEERSYQRAVHLDNADNQQA